VKRTIEAFHQDDEGDWVAELDCLHGQHVRHKPPLWPRPWVETEAGRAEHVGTELDCPRCDRAELPEGLVVARTAGPFTEETLPAALRRDHLVAARTWGLLRVLEGELDLVLGTPVHLVAGDEHPIPPGVPHQVRISGPVRLAVDFLVPPEG
jgi:tellurite resistance-related uncharacterized protein